MKLLRRCGRVAVGLLFGVWLVGQVFRDANFYTAFCFYVPSPVVAGALVFCVPLLVSVAARRAALVALVLAIVPAVWTVGLENQWRRPTVSTEQVNTLRLVHWNVAWTRAGWENIQTRLVAQQADVYVISELPYSDSTADKLKRLAAALGSDFTVSRVGSMALVAREIPTEPENESWPRPEIYSAECRVGDLRLKLLLVDVPSALTYGRAGALELVHDLIELRQPDLIVGDFNAPRRSWSLSRLPDGYRHGYDAAGSGWSYTWPSRMPVLAIDQCIVGPAIVPLEYQLSSHAESDHRMQTLDFVIAREEQ